MKARKRLLDVLLEVAIAVAIATRGIVCVASHPRGSSVNSLFGELAPLIPVLESKDSLDMQFVFA